MEAKLTTNYSNLKTTVLAKASLTAGKYIASPDDNKHGSSHTGTGAALGDAVHYLVNGSEKRSHSPKAIVLMSDGLANRPSGTGKADQYALDMADYAANNNVKVYTISLGDEADLDLMQNIAEATGGEHFDATGSGQTQLTQKLTVAFRQTAGSLKRAQLVK